jgi:hypothetical protein
MTMVHTTSVVESVQASSHEGLPRRVFVERLRQSALFVPPAVATIGLSAPRVSAGY